MKIAVCAIVRTENRYLPDWIEYHLNLGIEHIFLYDNARDGEELADEVLSSNILLEDKVTVIPYYNKLGAQVIAYADFYANRSSNFDYVAFIDIDEYITLDEKYNKTDRRGYSNLSEFIEGLGRPDAIALNWMTFGDCGLVYDDGRKDVERFQEPLPLNYSKNNMWGKQPFNCHIKTIYKVGLAIDCYEPHCSLGKYKLVNAIGMPIVQRAIQDKCVFENCYVKHFITRSISEYIETKVKRGCRVDGQDGIYPLADFFYYNKPTIQKIKIYRKYLLLYPNQPRKSLFWWVKCCLKMYIINPWYLRKK